MKIPVESLNLLMLNMGYARHHGDWNWKNIQSPFTRIFLVTEGMARLHTENGTVELTPNHLYIIPSGTQHSYECDGLFTLYYLHIYEGFKNETDVFNCYDFPTEVEATELDTMLMEQLASSHPEAKLPSSDPRSYDNGGTFSDNIRRYNQMPLHERMMARGSILMLFSKFLASAKPRIWTTDKRLTKVLQYINNNIYDDIDIQVLADEACVTKHYLIRIFRRCFGIAPLQYINRKKIEKAQLMLITSDFAIKELAFTLGFNTPAYFCRLFKHIAGCTPQEYRRNCK